MNAIQFTKRDYLSVICFPWKQEGKTHQKVAAWAAFFFIGWTYHPIQCLKNILNKSQRKIEIQPVNRRKFLTDPLSQSLSLLDNPSVEGRINGIYITANETNLIATRELFRAHPRLSQESQTIHIGCASWHNFDILCLRRPSYGLIIDFNPKNAQFIEKTLEIINSSESREIFKERIIDYLHSLIGDERNLFFHPDQNGDPTDRIEQELTREGSWLNSDENYLYIKENLAGQDRIVAITEDITNFEKMQRIRDLLNNHHVAIDSLYMSNICNFMRSSDQKNAFLRSIRTLLSKETLFINCPRLRNPETNKITLLTQMPVLGREILQESYDVSLLFEQIV